MRLHCEFSTPVARMDLDDYIRHLEISVGCYDEDALNEYIVGKLSVDQILPSSAWPFTAKPRKNLSSTGRNTATTAFGCARSKCFWKR
jgi:hypothetical protein